MPQGSKAADGKKHILLNAFDMSTIGHLSPGQWKVCDTQTQLQEIDLSLTSCMWLHQEGKYTLRNSDTGALIMGNSPYCAAMHVAKSPLMVSSIDAGLKPPARLGRQVAILAVQYCQLETVHIRVHFRVSLDSANSLSCSMPSWSFFLASH